MGKVPCQVFLVSLAQGTSAPVVRTAISECDAVWACCVLQGSVYAISIRQPSQITSKFHPILCYAVSS